MQGGSHSTFSEGGGWGRGTGRRRQSQGGGKGISARQQLLPNMSQLVKEAEIEAAQGVGGGVACGASEPQGGQKGGREGGGGGSMVSGTVVPGLGKLEGVQGAIQWPRGD